MKKILFYTLMFCLASVGFTSCSDDDELTDSKVTYYATLEIQGDEFTLVPRLTDALMSWRRQVSMPRLPSPRNTTLSSSIWMMRWSTQCSGLTSAKTGSPTWMSFALMSSALSRLSSRKGRMLQPRSCKVTLCPSSSNRMISGRSLALANCISTVLSWLVFSCISISFLLFL